jgi:hypothetical protein
MGYVRCASFRFVSIPMTAVLTLADGWIQGEVENHTSCRISVKVVRILGTERTFA